MASENEAGDSMSPCRVPHAILLSIITETLDIKNLGNVTLKGQSDTGFKLLAKL